MSNKYMLVHYPQQDNRYNFTGTGIIMAESNNTATFIDIMLHSVKLYDGIWQLY